MPLAGKEKQWEYRCFGVVELDAPREATLGEEAELGDDELVELYAKREGISWAEEQLGGGEGHTSFGASCIVIYGWRRPRAGRSQFARAGIGD